MDLRFQCIFLIFTIFLSSTLCEDLCLKTGPCSCEFSNGTGIDLSSAVSSKFYVAQMYDVKKNSTQFELHTYYYHPCFDAIAPVNSTGEGNTCGGPLSICRHVNTMDLDNKTNTFKLDTGVYNYLGSSNYSNFTSDRAIVYANGPSSTIVMLVCAETEGELQVKSLSEPNKIALEFYSSAACLKQMESGGRSTGSTLCIIFFSLVIFYLVLGIIIRKFLMGATGLEVIPDHAFWMDLPNLVKDGWAFAINGFKLPSRGVGPTTSPDPNSYDSI